MATPRLRGLFVVRLSPFMKYPPVGFCIYCGARNVELGAEHIIPYALNGAMVSCPLNFVFQGSMVKIDT
jgi:hypothetical protein